MGEVMHEIKEIVAQMRRAIKNCMHSEDAGDVIAIDKVDDWADELESLSPTLPVLPADAETRAKMHGMNCRASVMGHDEECTCGLQWRIALQTEIEMHAAWRKRAEEAETALCRYSERQADVAVSVGLAIYARMIKLAQAHNQFVGEKNNYYVTLEQLESAFCVLRNELKRDPAQQPLAGQGEKYDLT